MQPIGKRTSSSSFDVCKGAGFADNFVAWITEFPDFEQWKRRTGRYSGQPVQSTAQLGDAGRAAKVAALDDKILDLCAPVQSAELSPLDGPANDHRLLVNELMRLMLRQQFFTFVIAAPVEMPSGEVGPVSGTNNEAERTLRSPAMSRNTGRTSKTLRGARRQTVLHSVLESIRQQLAEFTLGTVAAEVKRWSQIGRSCFSKLAKSLDLKSPERSILDAVLPV